jgi:hypothetical protein
MYTTPQCECTVDAVCDQCFPITVPKVQKLSESMKYIINCIIDPNVTKPMPEEYNWSYATYINYMNIGQHIPKQYNNVKLIVDERINKLCNLPVSSSAFNALFIGPLDFNKIHSTLMQHLSTLSVIASFTKRHSLDTFYLYRRALNMVPTKYILIHTYLKLSIDSMRKDIIDVNKVISEARAGKQALVAPEVSINTNPDIFLANMHKYTIIESIDIINANQDAFKTHRAQFIIYMHLGLQPTLFDIDIINKTAIAMFYNVNKSVIKYRTQEPTEYVYNYNGHFDKYGDNSEFDLKKFAADFIKLNAHFGLINTFTVLKSCFTYVELVNLGLIECDSTVGIGFINS